QGLTAASPASRVLVLNFYQTDRAEFTADNSGRGLYPERIDAFNQALEEACAPGGVIAAYEQVTCVDIRPFFGDMPSPVVLAETTLEDYRAALYRETGFTPILDDYFAKNPDGVIIGDGIHLSLAGRDRLAERLAGIIFDMTDDFETQGETQHDGQRQHPRAAARIPDHRHPARPVLPARRRRAAYLQRACGLVQSGGHRAVGRAAVWRAPRQQRA